MTLGLTPELSVFLHGTLEQVRDAEPNEDRFFEDQGMFAEELYLQYASGPHRAWAGKFDVEFERGSELAPGNYGADFAEDFYEINERVGLGVSAAANLGELGTHRLSGSTFFIDTSPLSQSYPTRRGRTTLADGGVGNTENLTNWSFSLSSDDALSVDGLSYQLALLRQARGKRTSDSESGYSASLTLPIKPGGEITLTPFLEWVRFSDAGGESGARQTFLTSSVLAEWQSWNLAFSHTSFWQRTNEAGSARTDTLLQISGGYTFDFGLGASVGWKTTNVAFVQSETVGGLLTYTLEF